MVNINDRNSFDTVTNHDVFCPHEKAQEIEDLLKKLHLDSAVVNGKISKNELAAHMCSKTTIGQLSHVDDGATVVPPNPDGLGGGARTR